MENKERDRALQTPAEANRDKHINYLAAEEANTSNEIDDEENNEENNEDIDKSSNENRDIKHDADSGNDSTNQMLQRENLIDPGNEHNHLKAQQDRTDNYHSKKIDADAGSDATGTTGSKPE